MAARSGAPYERSAAGDLHRRPAKLRGPKGTEKILRLAPAAGLLLTTTLCLAPTQVLGQSSAPAVAPGASSPGGTATAQANLDAATEAFLAARAAEERAREALRSAASEVEERAAQAALEQARSTLADAQERRDQAQSALRESRLTPEQRQRRAQLEAGASTAEAPDAPLTSSPAPPVPPRLRTVEREPAPPPPALSMQFGVSETGVPPAGIGFTRPGGPGTTEFAAAETPDELTTRTYGVGLQLTVGGVPANLSFHYGEGSGTTAFSIDPGPGGDTGIVYGGLSPGGSSGIAAPFASLGSLVVNYERFGIRIEVPIRSLFAGFEPPRIDVSGYAGTLSPPAEPGPTFTPIVFVGVEDVSYDYVGLFRSNSLGAFNFNQDRDQLLHDTMIDVGVGGDLRVPLGGPFSLHASGRAGPYWLRSRLRSNETNSNNFTGPPDGSFTLEFREKDSSIGFHGAVAAGLEILLSRNVALGVSGSAHYRSRTGAVFNPRSGDQVFFEGLTTTLARDSSWSYGAQVGIRIGLGRR